MKTALLAAAYMYCSWYKSDWLSHSLATTSLMQFGFDIKHFYPTIIKVSILILTTMYEYINVRVAMINSY